MAQCPICGAVREVCATIEPRRPDPPPDGLGAYAVRWICRWCGRENLTIRHYDGAESLKLTCRGIDNGCRQPEQYLHLHQWQSFVLQEV